MEDKIFRLVKTLKRICKAVFLAVVILTVFFVCNYKKVGEKFLLYETIPFLSAEDLNSKQEKIVDAKEPVIKDNLVSKNKISAPVYKVYTDGINVDDSTKLSGNEIVDVLKVEDTLDGYFTSDIVGVNDVIFQDEGNSIHIDEHLPTGSQTVLNIEELRNFENLKKGFYSVDKLTDMTPDLFDVDKFMNTNLKITKSGVEPKILIFHTHTSEMYVDSDLSNPMTGIVGVGEKVAEILYNEYGVAVMHVSSPFDYVDGSPSKNGAYERMEPEIQKILDENPSIEVVLDLHRDGVAGDVKLVQDVNGKPTAKIMFFNGLSKLYTDGVLNDIESLPNPNLEENLAFSFNMQLKANELYPELARKIYLRAYRFSLHMRGKSLLVEVGAQTNTMEEAFNAAEPIARTLAEVILD